jgi:hypothetical protein
MRHRPESDPQLDLMINAQHCNEWREVSLAIPNVDVSHLFLHVCMTGVR